MNRRARHARGRRAARAADLVEHPKADRRLLSSCCGWPAGWSARTRSTRSGTRRSKSACRWTRSCARSRRSTPSWTTSSSPQGLKNVAKVMDRGTLIRSHVAARPRQHPALAAPVPLAHRLRTAATRSPARTLGAWMAPRTRAAQPGHPRVHQHRPAARRGRRERGAEGVHHRRILRHASSGRSTSLPADDAARRAAAEGDDAGTLRGTATRAVPGSCSTGQPGRRVRRATTTSESMLPSRWTTPTACCTRRSERPSTSRRSRRRATTTYNTGRFGLRLPPARRLAEIRRPVHRSDHRVRPVPALGHARERPHAASSG